MSSSIHDIIKVVNSSLKGIIKNGVWHGVASNVERNKVSQPEIDGKYAGIDDVHPLISYHKLISLTSSVERNKGYGDSPGSIKNTYSLAMVVFVNRKKCGAYQDDVFLSIQANLPEMIDSPPYKSVQLIMGRVDLDSETVYGQEYTNAKYKLQPEQYLFRINYTIETTFKKGCFNLCPQN